MRNDHYPSGEYAPAEALDASYGPYETYGQQGVYGNYAEYDGYSANTFDSGGIAPGEGGPLLGGYDTGTQYDTANQWATAQWDAGNQSVAPDAHSAYGNGGYEGYETAAAYGTGGYAPTSEWSTTGYESAAGIPPQRGPVGETAHAAGDWGTAAWSTEQYQSDQPASGHYDGAPYQADTEHYGNSQYDAGRYTAGQYDSEQSVTAHHPGDAQYDQAQWDAAQTGTQTWDAGSAEAGQTALYEIPDTVSPEDLYEPAAAPGAGFPTEPGIEDEDPVDGARLPESVRDGARRPPIRRSALLTVAVPSVAVMGMAGIAAASVTGITPEQSDTTTTQASAELTSVKAVTANNKLDTQLASLTEDAGDFADRASRTQERIDLKQRQLEEKKRREAEAARREALRPKFALPVSQHGLSAYFGQAGVNWMSVHTGIDFPVSYGTPVMAATDGTVRTQWNTAYGNMVIITAPDGTETWYCHLSSAKIRSGPVKAGQVIAFSGNSGNSTGPHLHFEVHPGGGAAVDPLPWLRNHGLDPS